MSDPAPAVVTAMAAATQSLRDTAKWLVSGVVATAAAVFAGSSLTSLGALDPTADRWRLELALGGLLVGFAGLACIIIPAFRVLVVETRTFREFADADAVNEPEIGKARERLLTRYRGDFPAGAVSFADYVRLVDAAVERLRAGGNDAADTRLTTKAAGDFAKFNADAGFQVVRNRFTCLRYGLAVGTVVAIVGFGLFAWAANPPAPKSVPPAFSLTIQGGR